MAAKTISFTRGRVRLCVLYWNSAETVTSCGFILVVSILHSLMVGISHSTSSAFSLQGRNIRFLRTAFNSTGEAFAAGDHQGSIFVFDLAKNR